MYRHTSYILPIIISNLILLQGGIAVAQVASAAAAAAATLCEGNASDACGENINSCTTNGLCVIDTTSGNCCYLSTYREHSDGNTIQVRRDVLLSIKECDPIDHGDV
jgi:hypothetical protein